MRLICRFLLVTTAALTLAACQTPATYAPRQGRGDTGYSDTQLASNRYRVTFTGNAATPRETVENYLLLRAAEVTLKAGYRYFDFAARDTKERTTYHSDFAGWPGMRSHGWYWHSWPYGPGWGAEHEVTTRPVTSYQAYAEIILLTDDQAKNQASALEAKDVIAHLEPPKP